MKPKVYKEPLPPFRVGAHYFITMDYDKELYLYDTRRDAERAASRYVADHGESVNLGWVSFTYIASTGSNRKPTAAETAKQISPTAKIHDMRKEK